MSASRVWKSLNILDSANMSVSAPRSAGQHLLAGGDAAASLGVLGDFVEQHEIQERGCQQDL